LAPGLVVVWGCAQLWRGWWPGCWHITSKGRRIAGKVLRRSGGAVT
jgi:hypothetical protein